jgi:TonB family protein
LGKDRAGDWVKIALRLVTVLAATGLWTAGTVVAVAQAHEPCRLNCPAQPLSDPQSWISSADYPANSIHGEEGRSTVALTIGRDGRASQCGLVRSSGYHALDQAACRGLMRRARFRPANDRDGQPIETEVIREVVWRWPTE